MYPRFEYRLGVRRSENNRSVRASSRSADRDDFLTIRYKAGIERHDGNLDRDLDALPEHAQRFRGDFIWIVVGAG